MTPEARNVLTAAMCMAMDDASKHHENALRLQEQVNTAANNSALRLAAANCIRKDLGLAAVDVEAAEAELRASYGENAGFSQGWTRTCAKGILAEARS